MKFPWCGFKTTGGLYSHLVHYDSLSSSFKKSNGTNSKVDPFCWILIILWILILVSGEGFYQPRARSLWKWLYLGLSMVGNIYTLFEKNHNLFLFKKSVDWQHRVTALVCMCYLFICYPEPDNRKLISSLLQLSFFHWSDFSQPGPSWAIDENRATALIKVRHPQ